MSANIAVVAAMPIVSVSTAAPVNARSPDAAVPGQPQVVRELIERALVLPRCVRLAPHSDCRRGSLVAGGTAARRSPPPIGPQSLSGSFRGGERVRLRGCRSDSQYASFRSRFRACIREMTRQGRPRSEQRSRRWSKRTPRPSGDGSAPHRRCYLSAGCPSRGPDCAPLTAASARATSLLVSRNFTGAAPAGDGALPEMLAAAVFWGKCRPPPWRTTCSNEVDSEGT